MSSSQRWLPPWITAYRRDWVAGDLTAGIVVAVMLIPQSLAYAMLAGLPPQAGLYASILPLVAYAVFGTSMTLAVGPVAVASLMTAQALAPLAPAGSPEYLALAITLALMSGVMLFLFGVLRFGFLAQFLSHTVIAGFISGAAVLIAVGQLQHLLGVRAPGEALPEILTHMFQGLAQTHGPTAIIGVLAVGLLWFARRWLVSLLMRAGLSLRVSDLLSKLVPMVVVLGAAAIVALLGLHRQAGVRVVGEIPAGLPTLHLPVWEPALWLKLLVPALLISVVGFVESVSVAQSFARKRRQRIDADRELLGLGAANLASSLSGGFPVTGGFARSVVNFAAGAQSPLAGIVSAVLMAVVLVGLTSWFETLPQAVLAATILVAVVGLIDFEPLRHAWHYDRADAVAFLGTFLGVVLIGVEPGIALGVGLSLAAMLWRSSQPHMAIVGRMPGTEHFRNVERHAVQTRPDLLIVRIDESLYFGNAQVVERRILEAMSRQPQLRHLVLLLSAVNRIDVSALEMLIELNRQAHERGIQVHLAEVKGPVMDRLQHSGLLTQISGQVFLSAHDAETATRESSRGSDDPSTLSTAGA